MKLLSKNDFEAVLATFCYYDHGAKGSEEVQKIATDQKEYREKEYLAVYFTKGCFFVNLLTERFYEFSAKVLPTFWIYKPGFYLFSLHKIKMSKQC